MTEGVDDVKIFTREWQPAGGPRGVVVRWIIAAAASSPGRQPIP